MYRKKTKAFIIITCLLLSAFLLSGCGKSEKNEEKNKDLDKKISAKLDAYQNDLMDNEDAVKSNKDIRNYLINWAKAKGITYEKDSYDNIIMRIPSSGKYKSAPPTAIICSYDRLNYKSSIPVISMALYAAKNNEKTGDLSVIFTQESGHDFYGIKRLKKTYFKKGTRIFSLNPGEKGMASISSGTSSSYKFTQTISKKAPSYTSAYKICIKGLTTNEPDTLINDITNPITKLEGLLVSLKNKGIGYEIAAFKGGVSSNLYAPSASLLITVDPNKEEVFTEKMKEETETWNKKNNKKNPEAKYSFKKAEVPSTVVSGNDGNKFVNFMYTTISGIYEKDEDTNDTVSICNVSQIDVSGNRIIIGAVAHAVSDSKLKAIDTDTETLCNLSDIRFRKTGHTPLWKGKKNTDFTDTFAKTYESVTNKKLEYVDSTVATGASYIAGKNKDTELISLTVNKDILNDCTESIIRYLLNSANTKK